MLYRLFEWAHRPDSAVVLVGIANGLDLTERVLPMLKGRGCSPDLINFAPCVDAPGAPAHCGSSHRGARSYSKSQFVEIIGARLAGLPARPDGKPVLERTAIDLCAAKVTSASGDLRNCLDLCRQCAEQVCRRAAPLWGWAPDAARDLRASSPPSSGS